MSEFAFNAPQFLDLKENDCEDDKEKVEAYFDVDHEFIETEEENEVIVEKEEHEEYFSPMSAPKDPLNIDTCLPPLRKSISMGNLLPTDDVADEEGISASVKNLQVGKFKQQSRSVNHLVRSISKDNLSKLAQPKPVAAPVQKYVSMQEAVNQFFSGVPMRFHSRPKEEQFTATKSTALKQTIPQSPALATKKRVRNLQVPSREEMEKIELEAARKFKIKANPVNPKILQGPVKPLHANRRPNTVIQPFRLTESIPKKPGSSPEKFYFHANPIPKGIYNKPKSIAKSSVVTVSESQNLSSRFGSKEKLKFESENASKGSTPKLFKPTKTQPMPFSFEQRDQLIAKKRELLLNKVLEEEKKAREFHAKPPPKYVTNRLHGSMNSVKSNKSDENSASESFVFRARPPTVLYQKPFEPKKPEVPLTEITEFQLNTNRRAKEREEFELKKKIKEEKMAEIKKKAENERLRLEEEQIARIRKELQHKAQPIRHFKEVKIVPTHTITLPISPEFMTGKRRNKEN